MSNIVAHELLTFPEAKASSLAMREKIQREIEREKIQRAYTDRERESERERENRARETTQRVYIDNI